MSQHFNLTIFNHADGRSYLDIIDNLKALITDLGHTFSQQNEFLPPPAINLVFEGFEWTSFTRLLEERRAGKRMVVVVTEIPTRPSEIGFLWSHRIDAYWSERAYAGRVALPLFDAAWCLVAGASKIIGRWVPSHDIELGYSPQLVRTIPEPVHDFCFFGSLNARRKAVVDEFCRRGHSVVDVWTLPLPHERDVVLSRAKVAIDIKIFDWWQVVSTSRIQVCLHAGRPIIIEKRGYGCPQQEWSNVAAVEIRDFVGEAAAMLPRWREIAAEQLEAMRRMDAAGRLRSAVDATLDLVRSPPRPCDNVVYDTPQWTAGPPRLIKSHKGVNLVAWKQRVYYVPQSIGPIEIDRTPHPLIREFNSLGEAEAALPI